MAHSVRIGMDIIRPTVLGVLKPAVGVLQLETPSLLGPWRGDIEESSRIDLEELRSNREELRSNRERARPQEPLELELMRREESSRDRSSSGRRIG